MWQNTVLRSDKKDHFSFVRMKKRTPAIPHPCTYIQSLHLRQRLLSFGSIFLDYFQLLLIWMNVLNVERKNSGTYSSGFNALRARPWTSYTLVELLFASSTSKCVWNVVNFFAFFVFSFALVSFGDGKFDLDFSFRSSKISTSGLPLRLAPDLTTCLIGLELQISCLECPVFFAKHVRVRCVRSLPAVLDKTLPNVLLFAFGPDIVLRELRKGFWIRELWWVCMYVFLRGGLGGGGAEEYTRP